MTGALRNAAERAFADIAGTTISGTLPLRESILNAVINEALPSHGRIQQIDIHITNENRLRLGVKAGVGPFSKWFHPEFLLARSLDRRESFATVLTAISPGYTALLWLMEAFARDLLPQGVAIKGREIAINLASIPQVQPYREYLRYLKRVDLATREGVIQVGFDVKVDQPAT